MSYPSPSRRRLSRLDHRGTHAVLWVAAVLTFGVADVATTMYFVATTAAVEGHPAIAAAIDAAGLWILIPWKVAGFAVLYGWYRLVPREWRIGVPIGVMLLGVAVTAWNLYLGVLETYPLVL